MFYFLIDAIFLLEFMSHGSLYNFIHKETCVLEVLHTSLQIPDRMQYPLSKTFIRNLSIKNLLMDIDKVVKKIELFMYMLIVLNLSRHLHFHLLC